MTRFRTFARTSALATLACLLFLSGPANAVEPVSRIRSSATVRVTGMMGDSHLLPPGKSYFSGSYQHGGMWETEPLDAPTRDEHGKMIVKRVETVHGIPTENAPFKGGVLVRRSALASWVSKSGFQVRRSRTLTHDKKTSIGFEVMLDPASVGSGNMSFGNMLQVSFGGKRGRELREHYKTGVLLASGHELGTPVDRELAEQLYDPQQPLSEEAKHEKMKLLHGMRRSNVQVQGSTHGVYAALLKLGGKSPEQIQETIKNTKDASETLRTWAAENGFQMTGGNGYTVTIFGNERLGKLLALEPDYAGRTWTSDEHEVAGGNGRHFEARYKRLAEIPRVDGRGTIPQQAYVKQSGPSSQLHADTVYYETHSIASRAQVQRAVNGLPSAW
jgi:hypothetical protein